MGYRHLFWAVLALSCLCTCMTSGAHPQAEGFAERHFENEDVSIVVKVHSGVYTYEVTNLADSAIVGFKVITQAAFAIIVPNGWSKEIAKEFLRAKTDDAGAAILPGQTESFDMYAIGKGSVLGTAEVHVEFQSGRQCIIDGVWAPVREPEYYTWLVVVCLLLIILAHAATLIYKDRRRARSHH